MNRIFKKCVISLTGGAFFTAVFFSLYAATNYAVPLDNGEVMGGTAGWTLDPDLFIRILWYVLPGSLLIFLIAGPLIYQLLKMCKCLNYYVVLISGAAIGFFIAFVFNKEISFLYHGIIATITASGSTVSWILHTRFKKNFNQSMENTSF